MLRFLKAAKIFNYFGSGTSFNPSIQPKYIKKPITNTKTTLKRIFLFCKTFFIAYVFKFWEYKEFFDSICIRFNLTHRLFIGKIYIKKSGMK